MQTVQFQNTDTPLYAKFNIKKGKIAAAFSIALFDKYGREMILYYKGKDGENEADNIVELPTPVTLNHERMVRCITDFRSLEPSQNNPYLISLEIYQGDKLLAEIEQDGELSYRQKCIMIFGKLVNAEIG